MSNTDMLPFTMTALLFYGTAFALVLVQARKKQALKQPFAILLTALGAVSHFFIFVSGEVHFQPTFFPVASVFALAISWVTLCGTWWRPVFNLFIALLPLNIAVILVNTLVASELQTQSFRDYSAGMLSHILLSILAYSFLAIASIQAIMLAWQHRQLKSKQVGRLMSYLPPIQTMEAIMFDMILIGELLLTISIISGVVFIDNIFEQHLVHKTVFSIVAWLIFAILLAGRFTFGWRGRQAVTWCLWGFVCLMLAYFGTKFVLELVLSRP